MDYKDKTSLEQRTAETLKLLRKYPDKVPVYIEIPNNDMILDKRKYLVDNNVTIMNLQVLIRKYVRLHSAESIYMLVNKKLIPITISLGELYKTDKNEDGLLYVQLLKENTFGSIL
jgi:hypothetical protein